MNSGNNNNSNQKPSKCTLLNKLRALDFAIIEAALFLDSHPTDKKALAYYKKMSEQRNMLRKQYTELYGPLTIFENTSDTDWDWVKGPWPWELED